MKNTYFKIALSIIIGTGFNSCQTSEKIENPTLTKTETTTTTTNDYIIELKENTLKNYTLDKPTNPKNFRSTYRESNKKLTSCITDIFKDVKIEQKNITATYCHALNGFAAKLTQEQITILKEDPRVENISEDFSIALETPKNSPFKNTTSKGRKSQSDQFYPWGVKHVGGAKTGKGKTAWVVDTGIDLDHPDLNVSETESISFVPNESANDENGHGTHVAGTIAAKDNNFGVIGVAPDAKLIAVKVLSNSGTGNFKWIISALDYIAANAKKGDVVNMSLGPKNRYTNNLIDIATQHVGEKGIYVVIAAGNSSDDCSNYSPARAEHKNIFTISNMTKSETLAPSSNYGTPVDYSAPGTDIESTWVNGGYSYNTGTSMAAPHVAGLLITGGVRGYGFLKTDKDNQIDLMAYRK